MGGSPETYPVMPLRNTVLFPQQVIPTYIGRDRSLKLIEDLPSGKKMIVVVAQQDGAQEILGLMSSMSGVRWPWC